MKYKVFEKCTKDGEYIYSKQKEIKEIHIEFDNGVVINITEHQFDIPLKEACVDILTKNGETYINLSTLINKVSI